MNSKAQILYYVQAGQQPPAALAALNNCGYECILQEVDPKAKERLGSVPAGSSTASLVVLDLGESSAEVAGMIQRLSPALKGRIVIVGTGTPAANGFMFATEDKLARVVREILG